MSEQGTPREGHSSQGDDSQAGNIVVTYRPVVKNSRSRDRTSWPTPPRSPSPSCPTPRTSWRPPPTATRLRRVLPELIVLPVSVGVTVWAAVAFTTRAGATCDAGNQVVTAAVLASIATSATVAAVVALVRLVRR